MEGEILARGYMDLGDLLVGLREKGGRLEVQGLIGGTER